MSAAPATICLSTSQMLTTSTGETWIRRNKSHLPYHPVPITPTRYFFWSAANATWAFGKIAAADRAAEVARNWRRFMRLLTQNRQTCEW